MRTQEEIVARIKAKKKLDFLGFKCGIYYPCLDFEHAKEFFSG
jgi:hypothetical protein